MNFDELKTLVSKGESDTLEFKKSTAKLHAAFETVCAFLNGSGGTVLIGVTDNRKIVGQQVSDSTKRDIASKIAQIEPATQPSIEYVDITPELQVIAIKVNPGEHVPYDYDGRSFQRTQSSTERMSQHRYEQKIIERGQLNHSWEESMAEGFDLSSIDEDRVYEVVNAAVQKRRIPASAINSPIEEILSRYKLIKDKNLNRAAIVLFAKDPAQRYPQCVLKMARFRGNDKFGEFLDNQKVFGNVFDLLDEADAFLNRHLPIASFFDKNKFERTDQPELPVLPVREALINAICHRNYSARSGSISLAIYDDRLEIWNNGSLPKELNINDLSKRHESWPRNPTIANIFYSMGLIETWGRGTNKMIDTCLADGLPAPTFEENSGGILVSFKFRNPIVTLKNIGDSKSESEMRRDEIVSLLDNGDLSASDIHKQLKNPPSLRTVKADLSELQSKGLICQVGKGKNTTWRRNS